METVDPTAPFLFGGKFSAHCQAELTEMEQAEKLAKQAAAFKRPSTPSPTQPPLRDGLRKFFLEEGEACCLQVFWQDWQQMLGLQG